MTGQPKRPWEASHHSSSHDFPGSHGRRQQVHSGLSTDIDFSVLAYEATLVYGQEAFARKLRLTEDQGGHLIRWTGADCGTPEMGQAVGQGESEVWIDRYGVYFSVLLQRQIVNLDDIHLDISITRPCCRFNATAMKG